MVQSTAHDIDCTLPTSYSTCRTCTLSIFFWHMSALPCLNQDFEKKKLGNLFWFFKFRQKGRNWLTCPDYTLPTSYVACRTCTLLHIHRTRTTATIFTTGLFHTIAAIRKFLNNPYEDKTRTAKDTFSHDRIYSRSCHTK